MKIFQLNWTAPSNNGGATITDYVVQYSSDGQTWTTYNDGVSNLTNTTVAGLTECASYQFRVAAVNSAGTGPYSSTVSAYLALPPETVSNINATYNGQDDVELTWSAPNDKGCSITDYIIQYSSNNGVSWNTVSDGVGTSTTHTIQNLPVGTYVFRVAAVNIGGTGTYGQYGSNITVTTTPAPTTTTTTTIAPSPISNVTVEVFGGDPSGETLVLYWDGTSNYLYSVQLSSDNGVTWSLYGDIPDEGYPITLSAGTYRARVAAIIIPEGGDPQNAYTTAYSSPSDQFTIPFTTTTTTTTEAPTTTTTTTTTTATPSGGTGYIVSGAGSPVNDTYCLFDTYNGKPRYKASIQYSGYDLFIQWSIAYPGYWIIGNDDLFIALYGNYYEMEAQITTGWLPATGDPDPPTLSATTCGATTTTTAAPTTTTTTTAGPTQYAVTASGPIDAFGAGGTYTFSNLDTNGLPVYGNGNGWYIAFYPVTETAGCWVMGDQNDGPSIYFNYFIASKSDLFESRSPLGLWADNCGGEALDVVVS